MCYISKSVRGIYLSEEACVDLGYVNHKSGWSSPTINAISDKTCSNTGVGKDGEQVCACPKRQLPPTDKPVLPCSPTKENVHILKDYILKRYSSSAFNTCEQQVLPLMDTAPPLRLYVDPQASPTAVMSPSTIPIHWKEDVKAGLDRDERLGVIEKVPVNVPVKWCSRMLITPKSNGSPPACY